MRTPTRLGIATMAAALALPISAGAALATPEIEDNARVSNSSPEIEDNARISPATSPEIEDNA